MIEVLSSWAKGLGLTIVIVSILEMLLPNNNTKKYIRMVMGVYIIFNIISPLIQNKDIFSISSMDLENYANVQASSVTVDQTSMDERIEELYVEELEKDITQKIEEQGYKVTKCNVQAKFSSNMEESQITKIRLVVEKSENSEENSNNNEENIEEKIVTKIQEIKTVNLSINQQDTSQEENKDQTNEKVSKTDVQNIKKFLIEEYEVSEKCLEIN